MISPPILGSEALLPSDVDCALSEWGGFSLDVGEGDLPWREALAATGDLFGRPHAAKAAFAIERSSHFRGWSEMHTERDWREQIHLGRELPAAGQSPPFLRLEGPNLAPSELGWRRAMFGYMDGTAALGERILLRITEALGLADAPFAGVSRHGHLVMKLIGYHPQPSYAARRRGVAPHVDFSWLTLTLQESPGLEVLASNGRWTLIEPRPGTLWVHAGELLQFATAGRYQAAAHRVTNDSLDRMRISIPLFVNPALRGTVSLFAATPSPTPVRHTVHHEHIHRVLLPNGPADPFHFGKAEWQRKGLGRWCAGCETDSRSDP